MNRSQPHTRLENLDGLRTVAILWVALYHYAYFWTSAGSGTPLLPYDAALAWIPLADVGYLGVYLFFIVSGFVIALSLTRSRTLLHFSANRAIRLWPTLLFCGSLTFLATRLWGPPDLVRSFLEYLISLTFIPPPHVGKVIGADDLEWLDGAYWSLWTEVRFYLIAATLYFAARKHFLIAWGIFALACSALHLWALTTGGVADALSRILFAEYQPYFTAGIAIAALRFTEGRTVPLMMLGIAIVQAIAYPAMAANGLGLSHGIGLVIVWGLAVPVMLTQNNLPILSSRVMVTCGVASYAYYLLHQNLGIALLNRLAGDLGNGAIPIMIAIQLGLLAFSVWATNRMEVPVRRRLRELTKPI